MYFIRRGSVCKKNGWINIFWTQEKNKIDHLAEDDALCVCQDARYATDRVMQL